MGEYLIFLKMGGGLMAAIVAAILIWRKKGTDTIEKPKRTDNGDYYITKPSDEILEGVEFDQISSTIKPEKNGNNNDSGDSPSSSDPSSSLGW